jgi:hypothetical protein
MHIFETTSCIELAFFFKQFDVWWEDDSPSLFSVISKMRQNLITFAKTLPSEKKHFANLLISTNKMFR